MQSTENQDWPLPPLIVGDWRELQGEHVEQMRTALAPHFQGIPATKFRVAPLVCYPGFLSVEALLDNAGPSVVWFLFGPGGVRLITGHSSVIHALNAEGALSISDKVSAAEYLRLFCSAVHGDEGPFIIVETVSQLEGLTDGVEPVDDTATTILSDVSVEPGFGGKWKLRAYVYYNKAVSVAEFEVDDSGLIWMDEDDRLFGAPASGCVFEGPLRKPIQAEKK